MSLDISRDTYTQNPALSVAPNEHIFNFHDQLQVSEEGERVFINYMNSKILRGKMQSIQDLRKDWGAQKEDIDFACFSPDGRRRTYEVKTDTWDSGNLFAEYMVNSYTKDRQGNVVRKYSKLGWLYGSQADRVFYYFTKAKTAYIFSLPQLAAWIDSLVEHGKIIPLRAAKNVENRNEPGRYYYGIGYLIKLVEMCNAPMMQGHVWIIHF